MVRALFHYIAIFCFSLSLLISESNGQSIRINEVVASNASYQDEDGDTPDWIELYNYGTDPVPLSGMTLTDDLDDSRKWTLPKVTLAPNQYLIVFASDKDRKSMSGYRTLINRGDYFKYKIPENEIGYDWLDISYDDSTWTPGKSGIGYGDDDDLTTISSSTQSIYLRKYFSIDDVSKIESLLLHMDYDDGFRAYINGQQVCGANLVGDEPAYNAKATNEHEAKMYSGGFPELFDLQEPELYLEEKNVLCVQVHNKDQSSTDLTAIPYLTALYSENIEEGIIPPYILGLAQSEFHTNFKISSSGETIALFDSDGNLIDKLETKMLASDVSYGVPLDDPSSLSYFSTPTPGKPNTSASFAAYIETDIVFSKEGGQTDDFLLTLSGADSLETIFYTLDGSAPSIESAEYVSPIPITKTTVVRARKYKLGYFPSNIQSQTYFIDMKHDLPVISLVVDPVDLFDEEVGIYSYGNDYSSEFPFFGANFWKDREKPVNISFYDDKGNLEHALDGGIKIFGGFSRAWEQKSLSLFARKVYGAKKIDYPVFKNLEYSSFNSIVLRNAGNDWINTNIRDGIMTTLMADTDLETQAFQPYVTYVNGEYWGIYNAREKINEHFLAAKSGVATEDIDFLELKGDIKHGSNTDYLEMYKFIEENDLSNPENYLRIDEQIDIDNYILYYVAQVYYDNHDWPGNNLKYWRARGGKWRWILFDTEIGFGMWRVEKYLNNTLAAVLADDGPAWPNPPWSTLIFRKLVQNDDFTIKFVNRFADEMNSRFLSENINNHIDSIKSIIETEVPDHFERWDGSGGNWRYQVANLKTFSNNRAIEVKQHILSELNIPAYHRLTIKNEQPDQGYLVINDRLTIGHEEWSGDYFEEVPFSISAISKPGYRFSHWIQGSSSRDSTITVNIKAAKIMQPSFIPIENTDAALINVQSIGLYPNPVSDLINITISNYDKAIVTVRLVNASGITIKELAVDQLISSVLNLEENISTLPSGVYFIELSGQQIETQSKKIIKH